MLVLWEKSVLWSSASKWRCRIQPCLPARFGTPEWALFIFCNKEASCCGLKMLSCPIPGAFVEVLIPKVMVVRGGASGRWWGHEVEASWMRLVPPPPKSDSFPAPSASRGYDKKRDPVQPRWHFNLGHPTSTNVGNKFLVFISHLICDISLLQPQWTKILSA